MSKKSALRAELAHTKAVLLRETTERIEREHAAKAEATRAALEREKAEADAAAKASADAAAKAAAHTPAAIAERRRAELLGIEATRGSLAAAQYAVRHDRELYPDPEAA